MLKKVTRIRKEPQELPIGICFEPLEPRLLLSGSWGAGAEAASPDSQANSDGSSGMDTVTISNAPEGIGLDALSQNQHVLGVGTFIDVLADAPALNPLNDDNEINTNESTPGSDTLVDRPDVNTSHEIVFINENVENYEQLIAGLQNDDIRAYEVLILDADRDGIEQISEVLAERSDLTAVHIITHGTDGQINLGNIWLNKTHLQQSFDSVSTWGKALTGDGDILFYGCNITADSAGQNLLNDIAQLTGADVAASDDLTGNAKRGGDWDLEFSKGEIETPVAFSAGIQQHWSGVLAKFTVNTTDDSVDVAPGDGVALDGLGNTSLRAAVMEANALAGADEIVLGSGNYHLSQTGVGESAATSGDLDVTQDLIITGAGAKTTTIDGDAADRVFDVRGANIAIAGVTIQNGHGEDGAGIKADGSSSLTLRDVTVRDNHVPGGAGGGIFISGVIDFEGVTIEGNSADVGGGIYINNGVTGTIVNSTLSGNTAASNGGAIFTRNTIDITNSTIADNIAGSGGGIFKSGSGNIRLKNSILSNNTGGNTNGALITLGNNIDSQNTAGLDTFLGDQIMTDPMLGGLDYNGGQTKTHALLAGSPAIDAGTNVEAPSVDQRDVSRGILPDVGAYEMAQSALWLSTTGNVISSGAPGLNSWENGEVIELADPNLQFDPGTTNGTFSSALNLEALAGTDLDIDALHFVTRDITLDTIPAVNLQAGDLLFSTNGAESSAQLGNVARDDIIRFRPDMAGDYSSGTFTVVVPGVVGGGGAGDDLKALTLIEQNMAFGDTTLKAGDFLLVDEDHPSDVYLYRTSDGTRELLVAGNDVGITAAIDGLELLETNTTLGDETLSAGELLVSVDVGDGGIGTSGITAEQQDIFHLQIVKTNLVNGTAVADAALLMDGSSLNLNPLEDDEDIDALTVVSGSNPSATPSSTLTVTTSDDVADGNTSSVAALIGNPGTDGKISLREAIIAANNTDGLNNIYFDITGFGPHTINLSAALPNITGTLVIDGTSEPDYGSAPVVRIDGSALTNEDALRLEHGSKGSTIRGLSVTGFSGGDAIEIRSDYNTIIGNYLGLATNGTTVAGNDVGVKLRDGADFNTIGGTDAADRNLLSGNIYAGVAIREVGTDDNQIIGNWIGLDQNGDVVTAGDHGVVIWDGPDNNRVGGVNVGEGNRIAGHNNGVVVDDLGVAALDNVILGNEIFSVNEMAIDLDNDQITANDAGDGDSGPNDLLNHPVLSLVTQNGADLDVQFDLDVPAGDYRIEFFDNPNGINANGYGGGEVFLGAVTVTSSGTGTQTFNETISGATMTNATTVTATATEDLGGNNFGSTSEFGPALSVTTIVGAIKDTYIDENNPANNYGTSTSLVMDESGGGLGEGHVLLQFDLSAIPAGAVITNATLQLQAVSKADIGSTDIHVYEVTQAWDEGTGGTTAANWNNRLPGIPLDTPWSTPGGAIDSTAVDTLTTSSIGPHAWDITALVQAWNDGAKTNNGLMLASDDFGQVIFTYDSREGTTPPQLVISYSSPVANTAPTVSGTYSMPSTDEDTTSAAVQVSGMLGDASITINDNDGDTLGIAVFAKTGSGTWEYSTNGSSGWTDFGPVGSNAALLLSESTWLRYVPDGINGETAGFDFRAWDQTTDLASINGTQRLGDSTPGGGTTAYSNGSANVTLTVNSVNDAPTTSPVTLAAIGEDSGARLITQADLLVNANDIEGDSLTATGLAISVGNGALVDNGNGTWDYTPAADDDTSVSFTYTITDGTDTVAGSATLDITPVNDAPTTSPVTLAAIGEDSGARLITQADLLVNANDIEGDSLTATGLAISVGNGALVDNGNGTWDYTPAADDDTSVSFTYTITDGTDTVAGSATLDITPVNDAPTTSPVTLAAIGEDSGARLITQADLLVNANDIEGDSLTATGLAISVGNGALVDNGNGTWDYTPAADDDTSVSFTYTITDGTDTVAGSATLDITPVNDAPTTSPVTLAAIGEDSGARLITQADLLVNANDIEGDSLTATGLAISVGNGALVDNGNGTWDYTPAADDDTSVSFTYTITDGTDTVAGSATLDITPVNDAPTTSPVTLAAIGEDSGARLITQADLLVNANDIEGDSLTATGLAISVGNGALVDNGNGTWDYTPAADDDTSVSFTYTITDGTDTVAGSATLDITPVNDAPTTSPVTLAAIGEDSGARLITQADLLVNANDIEGDSLTATGLAISVGNGALVDNGNGTWDYTPAADDDTSVSFTYTITDGTDTVAGSATLDITPVNDAPTTSPVILAAIGEDSGARLITQADLLVNANDIEGDSLTATGLAISVGNGALVDNGNGTWDYTPAADDDTSVSFTYTITDGTDTVAGSATLDITPVNDAPTTSPVTLAAIGEDSGARLITQADLLVNANDIEGDSLTATGLAISVGNGALVDNGNGTWDYTPAADDDTSVSFTYTITDGTDTVAGSATLDITPVNDAPTTSPVILAAIGEDSGARLITQADLLVNANDIEGDSLTATGLAISVGNGALVDNGNGTWDYTPAADDDTSVSFTYTITDGTDTVAGSATLDITPVNDAPTTSPVTLAAIGEDSGARLITQADLLVNANDIEGDSLTATGLAISVGNGALVDNGNGTWDYTPAADDDTSVSFTYTITDATDTVAGSATLDITPVNDAPTTSPVILAAIGEDSGARLITQADLLVNANDIEGDSLTATGLAISVGNGALVDNGNGTWDYTPAADDDTSVSFTYTITDGTDTVAGSATLDITPVNDAPAVANVIPDQSATEDTPFSFQFAANTFNDVDAGDSLTYTALGLPSWLAFTAGTRTFSGMPANADVGTVTITVRATDASNAWVEEQFDITVANTNDVGTVAIDNLTPTVGDTLTAIVNDPDGATGAITYQWFHDGVIISGATSSTYTTVLVDEGKVISVTANYTDDRGTLESLTSAGTAPVAHLNVAPTAANLNAAETYTEDIPLDLSDIVIADIDSANVTVTLTLSDPAAGSLSTGTSGGVTANFSGGTWTASGPIADVNALLAGVVFTPSINYDNSFTIDASVDDGVAAPISGIKIITATPVGDTPQVSGIITPATVQSGLIVIDRNPDDGAEVTYFRISNITNGTLYLSDGVTPIHNGDYISFAQGQVGVRFTPTGTSIINGSFTVESSEDGISVAQQSGAVVSVITVVPPPTLPTESSLPTDSSDPAEPETATDSEVSEPAVEPDEATVENISEAVEAPPVNPGPSEESAPRQRGSSPARTPFLINVFRSFTQNRAAVADVNDNAARLSNRAGGPQKDTAADPGLYRAARQISFNNTMTARAYHNMVNSLDDIKEEIANDNQINKVYLGSAIVSSVGLSVGYVVWLIRGGMLLSTLLSSIPAWQILDPLPVLARKRDGDHPDDDESLETILDQAPRKTEPKKKSAEESSVTDQEKDRV